MPDCRSLLFAVFLSLFLAAAPAVHAGQTTRATAAYAHAPASGVYYEIFVRSFYDSNGDGIGDLNGITEKMGYLKSLGVSGIWLTPINPSPSYHGYDVTNYFAVNPQFGTIDDLRHLVRTAHADGIKVLMDLVINHTSNRNPWFIKAQNPNSPYHDWYVWAGKHANLKRENPWGDHAWRKAPDGQHYLGVFTSQMPDLNYDNPAVRREMIKVGQFWLKQGVDGFRLDAAKHIYINFKSDDDNPHAIAKNVAWWKQFHAAMKKVDPKVFLVGEVSAEQEIQLAPYYAALTSVFNFPLADSLIGSAASERSADLGARLQRAHRRFDRAAHGTATDTPFLSNHDQDRVIDQLDGNREHMRMAAAMLLTLPGDPFVYYGEEIGMRGSKPDPDIREPMRWDRSADAPGETRWETDHVNTSADVSVAAERDRPDSLLNFYRTLIHWRRQLPALRDGSIAPYPADRGPISAYVRADAAQRLLVVHNLSGKPQQVKLLAGPFTHVIRHTRKGVQLDGHLLSLPPYSTAIVQ
ncbi:alpha-amylase family glycosyl hydrolase [Oleiagrimonas sp.]|jgi:alpha-amylase|uniref:alpha-amylase family glycosyl hydrolase n=1 Tax=Oleiagrimonas sp. TaxID=2010330 RepID=UPI0026159752|nr:alpha-amylase family glycosyl hydrolase [Oleiagrimonas sp.]MDA3913353.1 alpha-amylase family glycosyl hydrolase [Oleiagrimonas sp.]